MKKVLIVGSGAGGVHCALSLLRKGYEVVMLDVGNTNRRSDDGERSFSDLKTTQKDPVKYFLGEEYESVVYPDSVGEYYGFPPNKHFIFSRPQRFTYEAKGFSPLFSFGQGGLAEAWTGGVYPLAEGELREFPFAYGDLEPYYDEVAERIGITGEKDDLARFLPVHRYLSSPLKLDVHSQNLFSAYAKQKDYLNSELKCYLGRSRVAVLTKDRENRKACTYLGRCLWGCPSGALYTPSITLAECRRYSNFKYLPNMYVTHFEYSRPGCITSIVAEPLDREGCCKFSADKYVLAAGTLSSSKIFMESILKQTGQTVKLPGLMDNRQILIPFLNLRMIGEEYNPESYQYHHIAMGIESEIPEEYIHGQITTLKTGLMHPIIGKIPMDLAGSIFLFRSIRAGLGIVNVNLHDRRQPGNYVSLESDPEVNRSKLVVRYSPPVGEDKRIRQVIRTVKRVLWKLGCVVPPGTIHVRPMGASVHYAGTIPMSSRKVSLTSSRNGRSHDFENLYIVDGTTFPFLPAKNLTFTLMANAIRIANNEF